MYLENVFKLKRHTLSIRKHGFLDHQHCVCVCVFYFFSWFFLISTHSVFCRSLFLSECVCVCFLHPQSRSHWRHTCSQLNSASWSTDEHFTCLRLVRTELADSFILWEMAKTEAQRPTRNWTKRKRYVKKICQNGWDHQYRFCRKLD